MIRLKNVVRPICKWTPIRESHELPAGTKVRLIERSDEVTGITFGTIFTLTRSKTKYADTIYFEDVRGSPRNRLGRRYEYMTKDPEETTCSQ